jgi:peptidoglycan/xylan/chitin deacetylase (PgdA/CDA1 family)
LKYDLISLIKLPDSIISKIFFSFFQEKNSLIIFLFHGLFKNEQEKNLNLVDPQTWIMVEDFKKFVEYYLDKNYKFVSPNDILKGLIANRKYAMITFDDGYYNNQYTLPILKKYKIPATFFISTNQVKNNRCFWWDVLYREMNKQGYSIRQIKNKQNWLKTKSNKEIEKYLIGEFGAESFHPKNDIDRPFSPAELKEFSKDNYVFLGNHTSDHSILTNYNFDSIKSQLISCQKYLQDITGNIPIIISYPNGSYSSDIINISKEIGLKLGITTYYKKNYLPIDLKSTDCMSLGRFDLSGNSDILKHCEMYRSDTTLYSKIWNLLNS